MKKANSDDAWWRFLELCSDLKGPKQFGAFYDLFLTIDEKEDLAKRYTLVKALLDEKKTQREISEDLNISISKITRGSNALKIIDDDLRRFLKAHMAG